MKSVYKVPLTLGCFICQKRLKSDRLLAQLLFWLPDSLAILLVVYDPVTKEPMSKLVAVCEDDFVLADKNKEIFMMLARARFAAKPDYDLP